MYMQVRTLIDPQIGREFYILATCKVISGRVLLAPLSVYIAVPLGQQYKGASNTRNLISHSHIILTLNQPTLPHIAERLGRECHFQLCK